MKTLNSVRWAAFLMTVLANADVAEAMFVDRPAGEHARCDHCGETGPTVPAAPVVFGARPAAGSEVPQGSGNGGAGAAVGLVRPTVTLPVWEEFGLASPRPAVGVVMTR